MRIAVAHLKSLSPYSQSQHHTAPMLEKESHDDYAQRTWREHLHVNPEGRVFVPPMAFKNCLTQAAQYIGLKIPGEGKKTFTKKFESGVIIPEPLALPFQKEDVAMEKLFLPSDGVRGSGRRVWKYYPIIHSWEGDLTIYILDATITGPVLRRHLREGGTFIGIGRFRPAKNGYYGRYSVESLSVDSALVKEENTEG